MVSVRSWCDGGGYAEGSLRTNLSGGGLEGCREECMYQSEWGRVRGDAEGSVLPI